MTFRIRSGAFSACVRTLGAELASLVNQQTDLEYIWQADPSIWAGSAPVLFPIVGRLKDDQYEWQGQRYSMPGHGVVRQREFSVTDHTDDSITMRFDADTRSRQQWPFEFGLSLQFSLQGSRLEITHSVSNTGDQTMPFTLGAHPAFRLDAHTTDFHPSQIREYAIKFSNAETLDRYELDGTVIGDKVARKYMDESQLVALHADLFSNDALIFKGIRSKAISLVHRERGTQVTVETGSAPHLGIWAKPGAPYVCIEPWHGYSDAVSATGLLQDKPSMMQLDPGRSYCWTYAVCVF